MSVRWRVPTDMDFMKLELYLGMSLLEAYNEIAIASRATGEVGSKISTLADGGAGTNETNFSLQPCGLTTSSYASATSGFLMTKTLWQAPTYNYAILRAASPSGVGLARQEIYSSASSQFTTAAPVRLVRDLVEGEESLADGASAADYTGNDGQEYATVRIGSQVWLAESLIETKYYNAEDIIHFSGTNWTSQTAARRGYPNNDIDNSYTVDGSDIIIGAGFVYNQAALVDPRLIQNNSIVGNPANLTTYTVTYTADNPKGAELVPYVPRYGRYDDPLPNIVDGVQTVISGNVGWAISVEPLSYIYEMDKWDDELETSQRLERNVTSNLSFEVSLVITDKKWRAPEQADWTNLFSNIPGGILMAGYHLASHLGNTYNFDMKQAGGVTGNPGTAPTNFNTAAFIWSGVRNVGTYSFYVLHSSSNNQMTDTNYSYSNRLYSVRLCRDLYFEEMFFWEDGEYLDDYVGNDGQTYKVVKIGNLAWTAEHSIETKDKNSVDLVDWNSPGGDIDNAYTEVGGVKTINYGLLHSWVELHGEKGAGIANDTYTPIISEGDRFSKEAALALRADDSYLDNAVSRAPLEVDDANGDMAMGENNIVFLFQKDTQAGSASPFNITWKGESTIAPSSKPVVLQVYNHNTSSWDTLDTDDSTAADTGIVLTAAVNSGFAVYYDTDKFISVRVYQDVST